MEQGARAASLIIYSFPEEKPDSLVRLQKEHWDPLFVWVKETLRVDLNVATGFSPARQSKETVLAFRKAIESLDHWEMACAC